MFACRYSRLLYFFEGERTGKKRAAGKNQYVPLKDYIIKLQRINLRPKSTTRKKHLGLVKTLKK